MELSPRSFLTAGISLTAATAVAFTPLVLPPPAPGVSVPEVSVSEVRLAVTSAQIGALAGVPGRALIGVVGTIVRTLDGSFTALIDATNDPTGTAALSILKTFSVDAFAKLEENLTLGNAVITSTATEVGDLVASAVSGSLRHLADGDLPAAGLLLAGHGLAIVQALGDAAFELVRIAVGEVTFQFNNAVTRLGELANTLAGASGSPLAETAVAAVQTVAPAPARTVFDGGSPVAVTTVDVAHTGFDTVVGGRRRTVQPVDRSDTTAPQSSGPTTGFVDIERPAVDRAVRDVPAGKEPVRRGAEVATRRTGVEAGTRPATAANVTTGTDPGAGVGVGR
ncbi:hypothetical protein ACN27E_02680 [Mycobacterium sp. WMMD1722]|uniref:hypothetical protein n=1 Tax=Mycobacterium sp. WMMD1722 TaxID=3404117 RepID=UPI003BF6034D